MARASLEQLKDAVGNLMAENERDHDSLEALLNHTMKMLETLETIQDQEEQRIDDELLARKRDMQKMFSQLKNAEKERQHRLERQIAEMDGEDVPDMQENGVDLSDPDLVGKDIEDGQEAAAN